ncbi:hypothetical protein C8R43DRAFT_1084622 [Mycena crocata]|nr:hypothetical protein C8R43DRAFT_1084622 [Mycena crocata]
MSQSKANVVLFDGRIAQQKLDILIIGGGIAGMATAFCLGKAGHRIRVVEAAQDTKEVGAGIQVGPNMSRLLVRWGLREDLEKQGVKPLSVSFLKYSTGERVGFSLFGETMEAEHGAPYYHLHRADLLNMLAKISAPYTTPRGGSRVVSVDPEVVSATLETGEILFADLILGADGVKSITRSSIFGGMDDRLPAGDSVYRAIIPTARMKKDPLLKSLVSVPEVSCWMGPGKHVVGYCIRGKRDYNLVLLCPDNPKSNGQDSWTAKGDSKKMRAIFKGWEPRVENLLKLVETTMTGQLVIRKPLKTWVSSNGRIALIGDACHPMLPYRAQGAAMAVEDAAALGNLLSRISSKTQIAPFLKAYEKIRMGRTTATQAESWTNRTIFHLPDGAEQEARDKSMRLAMTQLLGSGGSDHRGNANMWADKQRNLEQFSYDADEAVNRWWLSEGAATLSPWMAKM